MRAHENSTLLGQKLISAHANYEMRAPQQPKAIALFHASQHTFSCTKKRYGLNSSFSFRRRPRRLNIVVQADKTRSSASAFTAARSTARLHRPLNPLGCTLNQYGAPALAPGRPASATNGKIIFFTRFNTSTTLIMPLHIIFLMEI